MAGTELQNGPKNPRARILPGLPKAFAGIRNFRNKDGKTYLTERMASFILSRRAFLDKRLENRGKLFRKEMISFINALFDGGKATAVEYGNKEDLEFLTTPRYALVSANDRPETREGKIGAIATYCMSGADGDHSFLDEMKLKFFQNLPVSENEVTQLKEMEQNQNYSRYFHIIRE